MSWLPSGPHVVVIGAGAAGIGAGRELRRRGIPHLIVEARDRVGGRAWTADRGAPRLLDLGCEWLHSADRNVLAMLAPGLGAALDKSEPTWSQRHEQVGFGAADREIFDVEQRTFEARLEQAARAGTDAAASDFLDPDARWNGLLDAISTYYNGAPLSRVSVVDYVRYTDTEVNWRVRGGLGAFVAALAEGLPIRTGCGVTGIDARGHGLRVATESGTIETDVVIVTLPTNVLASGAVRFDPPLPAHMAAAAGLPLGVADKVFLMIDEPEAIAPDSRLLGRPGHVDSGSYVLRAKGLPLAEGYFGGDFALDLERGGLPAFADAARREIGASLGADVARNLTPIVATAWARDPLAQGSYSHALPGRADDRAMLATPVDGRVFFAGEATSPHSFSTAHGAFEEGERAARAVTSADRAAAAGARR